MVSVAKRRDVGRLGRRDLLLVSIHFALPSGNMEDWIGWARDMLVKDGFVEVLCVVGILKSIAMSQNLQISGDIECLCRMVKRWCTSTYSFILAFREITMTLEDVANIMLLHIVGEEDPFHIALTSYECFTEIPLRKAMRKNASSSS